MKKYKIAAAMTAAVAALSAATVLVACGNKDGGKDNTDPVQLAAPVISLNDNVVSWAAIPNAVSYSVTVGDGAAVKVTTTEYEIQETAVGSYPVYVVAVAAVGGRYTDSERSDPVTYVVEEETPDPGDTSLKSLALVHNPDKTEYFLDETSGGGSVDLSGVVVNAVYGNGDRKKVTATVDGTVDLTTVGDKTVWLAYSENGGDPVKTSFVVTVRERTESDIGSALVKKNYEYSPSVSSYEIADGEVTAVDMKGAAVTVTTDGGKSKISFTGTGTRLIKVTAAGGEVSFVKVTAAYYVRTAQEFLNIKNDLTASYILQNDIVLEGNQESIGVAPVKSIGADGFTFDKNGYTEWSYPAEGVYEHSGEAGGTPFTGTLDGNGYVISGYRLGSELTWQAAAYYHGLFGYIGKQGVVQNLTLRNATVEGGQFGGFIAGVNLGTIKNIVIEGDSLLKINYGRGGYAAGYNDGTIENVVSYSSKLLQGSNGNWVNFNSAASESGEDATAKNVYIGNTTDLTGTLGEGWFHVDGIGTVYGNDSYKKVISMPDVMYETDDGAVTAEISVYQKTQETVSFVVWINGTSYSDDASPLKYVSYDQTTQTYTVKLETTALLDAGDTFTLGVKSDATGLFIATGDVTVGEPYAVSASYSGSALQVMQGTDIVLSSVTLDVKYTDGSVRQENPVKVEGWNKLGAVGTAQTVKFFYGTGSDEFTEISVTPTEVTGDVVTAVSATKKTGVDKIVVSSGDEFDILDYYDVTVTYSEGGQSAVQKGDAKLSVGAVKSGKNNITLTYIDGASVSTTVNNVEIWQSISTVAEWNGINASAESLAGYYILSDNIDLTGAQSIGCLPLNQTGDTVFDIADTSGTGKPFTGKFDGNNKTITGFKTEWNTESGWAATFFGGALFNYVGAGAEVKNFTLSGAQVQAPNYTAFIASCNSGLIESVTVEGGSIYAHFGGSTEGGVVFGAGAIACYNYGTVKGCTSDVDKFTNRSSIELDLALVSENLGSGKVE